MKFYLTVIKEHFMKQDWGDQTHKDQHEQKDIEWITKLESLGFKFKTDNPIETYKNGNIDDLGIEIDNTQLPTIEFDTLECLVTFVSEFECEVFIRPKTSRYIESTGLVIEDIPCLEICNGFIDY